ncbi:uncharacterized protein LOC134223492 isoform X2 [Armigeres subalbatus]|uniref:uncharacterized protein LOC134223492 isoform X2 n=1 Tax=Armigeres subalbatus TaxID=124917 RepID=UPI002ED55E0D
MSAERLPSHDDADSGGGGGGGNTIIGGHVTVETSSPALSPRPDLKDSVTSFPTSIGSNMVLSSIPLEANHQLILQQHLAQQQHHIIATSGNTNQNSNSSAISSVSNGGVGSNHSIIINNNTSFKNHNSNNSNNIIISGSGIGGGNSNNHTYTINLSSSGVGSSGASHNGHAMIQSYATPANSGGGSTTTVGHHGHHQPQFYSAPNNIGSVAGSLATAHSNGAATASSTATVVAPPASSSATSSSSSKLVVLQQGHLGENYITTTDNMNGVGNIVLLATEQMDMSSAEHDFINNNVVITTSSAVGVGAGGHLSHSSSNHHPAHQQPLHHHSQQQQHIRTGTVLTATNGAGGTSQVVINTDEELTPLTWLHDKNLLKGINLNKVPVSSPDSPRQAGGHLSPTSDFVEDSSVSEDNTSSANSSSDQSIGVFCTETIPSNARHVTVGSGGSTHHTFQLSNGVGGHKTITTINGSTIVEYPVISSDDKELKSPSSTVSCASSASSTSSLYNSAPSPNPISGSAHNGSTSGASTPHQHFHKKYLREEHVKQLKQVSSSYATPVKQLSSAVKYEEGEIIEERPYPPAAPMKNGYPSMATSPNVSSDEYGSTYGSGGGSMRPPSPPPSPQHHLIQGQSMNGGMLGHPPSSPQPQSQQQSKLSPPKSKHPTNVPYDPLVHIQSKPPFSFSSLIFMAIENAQQKALPVKEIYAWIVQHFPYFKTAPTGWKNSVRHNLSLNKCFQKVEKAANLGKGSLWMVEPQYRPNLIQALSRSPFHSGSGIDKTTYKAMQQQAQQQAQQQQRSTDSPTSSVGSNYSKDNFPYLASRLAPGEAQSGVHLSHHLNGQQQHPSDLDGDDFSRSSTPVDYDGDLPHQHLHHNHQSAPGGVAYHMSYHHLPSAAGALGPPSGNSGGTNGLSNGYIPSGSMILPNGQTVPAAEIIGRDWSADTIDDVNAATAMLALKHGPKIFTEGFQNGTPPVITTSPSEDHTYSAGGSVPPPGLSERSSQNNSDNNSNGTSSDAAYESSEESHNLVIEDQEEQRRQAGVDALLNLAGITNYAPMSGPTGSTGLKRPADPTSYDDPPPHSGPRSPYHQSSFYHQQQLETTPPSGYSSVAVQQHQQPPPFRNYYMPDDLSVQYSPSPSPAKKSKPSTGSSALANSSASSTSVRMLKKFKKKASWVR